jgi:hypothetical protein
MVQANVMMVGETLCMVAYLLYLLVSSKSRKAGDPERAVDVSTAAGLGSPSPFLFLPPALCDVTVSWEITPGTGPGIGPGKLFERGMT